MTAQDIKEKTFEKAVFGGYDMAGVDDFLEEVADGYTALQKENAVLKGKMKVLVEKIEEYRSTEDAMRLALLSAQKMSVQIENDAKDKAKALSAEIEKKSAERVASAKAEAERIVHEAKNSVAGEENKIAAAKQATANFVARIREICSAQLAFLDNLDDMQLPEPEKAPAPEDSIRDTVKTIEDSVAKMVDAPAEEPQIDIGDVIGTQNTGAVDEPTRLYEAAPASAAAAPEKAHAAEDEVPLQFDFEALSFDD